MANLVALKVAVVLQAIDRMSEDINKAVGKATKTMQRLGDKAFAVGQSALGLGVAMGGALAVPIKAAAEFETGMTNVRKVVDGLGDEKAFKEFSAEVLKLGRELPIAYDQLTEMVAASGRMGIAKDQLIGYTREVGKMAIAFEMSAGDVGKQMGKISNIFEIAPKDVTKLADAFNYLDDKTQAEGRDILDVMLRIGGTSKLLSMPAEQAAALGATMLSLGSTSETAGTAINAFYSKLATATTGKKDFQATLKMLGLDPKQIEEAMASGKAQETIVKVMDKLRNVQATKRIGVANMLFGGEYFKDAGKLASGLNTYLDAIKNISDRDKTGKLLYSGSMDREYQARMKTTAAQFALFKNNMAEIAITLGNALLPAVNEVMASIKPYIDSLRDWAAANPELVAGIGKVVAILAATTLATSALGFVFGGVFRIIGGGLSTFKFLHGALVGTGGKVGWLVGIAQRLWGWMKKLGGIFTWFGGVFKAVWRVLSLHPIVRIITLVATAAFLIYKYWEPIKNFFVNLWDGIKNTFFNVWEWIKGFASAFYEAGKNLLVQLWEGMKSMFTRIRDGLTAWFSGDIVGAIDIGSGGAITQAIEIKRQQQLIASGQPVTGGGLAGLSILDKMRNGTMPTPASNIANATNNNATTTNNQNIVFSPNITVQGGADASVLEKANKAAIQTLKRELEAMYAREGRKSFNQ